jgi:CDP-glycerol glycerophosphotransferase (TagB/SpsB family)/glycosyltransferase involved in cell wall biosynthesis
MTGQQISVVVPFYNNAALLGDCLASIAAQTHRDLEVIMVDDGSTDGSAEIARAQAAADPRFRLVSQPNGGPGSARNCGVAAAAGEFLAFVDADDMLPAGAYETMLAVLGGSGSDFVCGGVLRLTAAGLGRSGLHARAVKGRRLGTHISRTPELFYDISVWNKLFRRSFWDAAQLSFPEGMHWEDLVAMTKAHVLARAVDVITEPVYHWRDRDQGAPSITQSRTDIGNIRDRITALGMIDEFLRDRGTQAMLRQHQHKALLNDLWLYMGDLPATGADYQREFAALTAAYLAGVTPGVSGDLPATRKLAYYLIGHGLLAELIEYAGWLGANPGRTPPMVRARGRLGIFGGLRADLPLRGDAALAIPDRVFRPQWRELDPYVGIDAISWRGGPGATGARGAPGAPGATGGAGASLRVEGWAYVPSMDIGRRRDATKIVALVPRGRRLPPLVLPTRQVCRPDVTAASAQNRYRYDWAGFRCDIPARLLHFAARWLPGTWDCVVLVRGRATWRPARLHAAGPPPADPGVREVAPGVTARVQWTGGRLQLRLRREKQDAPGRPDAAGVTLAWGGDGMLLVSGRLPATAASSASAATAASAATGAGSLQVVLRHLDGWETHAVDAGVAAGGRTFSAAVPVGAIEVFGVRQPLRDGQWAIGVRGPDGNIDCGPAAADGKRVTVGPKVYRCAGDGISLRLLVAPVLGLTERGRIRRRLLRDIFYRAQRLLPVREQILFSSFHGKQCGDNPRPIADELRRRGDARQQIWAITDRSVLVPEGADAVLIGTRAYFRALARSRYLICNDHVSLPYRKRRGQQHVQTWHGTPLKRLGYDISEPSSASGRRYLDYMAGDVAQWDMLLSPNPFSTPIMREAFRFSGEICETGYPRNDMLVAAAAHAATNSSRLAAIRQRIGLPAGRKVAIYVPTWRDNRYDEAGRYLLDFRLDLDAAAGTLADDWVLLIRGHHLMAGGIPDAARPGFAFDVTGYPDIGDLLLITDALITDYSSVMFDFAPTGRPMLFFTYDLEQYRDQVRGFYFDFQAEAPGPLLATSQEVVAALADLDAVAAKYAAAAAAFTARFCPLDDGNATARACDRIFGA